MLCERQASTVILNYNHSPIFNFSRNFSVVHVYISPTNLILFFEDTCYSLSFYQSSKHSNKVMPHCDFSFNVLKSLRLLSLMCVCLCVCNTYMHRMYLNTYIHTYTYINTHTHAHIHMPHIPFQAFWHFSGHRDLSMLRMDLGSITLYASALPSGYLLTRVLGIIGYTVQVHVVLHVLRVLNCKLNSIVLMNCFLM